MRAIKLLLFFLVFTFVFPLGLVKAASELVISLGQNSVVAGNEFQINLSPSGLDPLTNYYIKALGGVEFYEVQTFNTNWLSWNGSWSDMPQFTSPDASASATPISVKARFKGDTSAGSKEVKVRIRKTAEDTNIDSNVVTMSVEATPTPSPTATPSPSPTASPTPSPTATATPTPKPTPKPTKSPTPLPSATPSPTPIEIGKATSTPTVLGVDDSESTSGPTTPLPVPAIVMIGVGVVFTALAGASIWRARYNDNAPNPHDQLN